ncbi:MAG: phosphate acyltransferase PlsX [Deinococcales bacterium]
MSERLPIALDAMGGDHAPAAMVEGAIQAAKQGVAVILVGREEQITKELETRAGANWRSLPLSVVHAPDVIQMEDAATEVRRNKNLSINVAVQLVRQKKAGAVVAQGHTGATLVSALFGLGRLPGVERPAIVANFPNSKGRVTFADVGANADNRPEFLQGFALMGAAYSSAMQGIANPTVGLLTIGEEEGKGNVLVNETFNLLKTTPGLNFYGNVEGRDIFKGTVDVVVTDGFTGNVVLKTAEAEAKTLVGWIKEAIQQGSWLVKLGALLVRPALRAVAAKLDPAEFGAQPLLGVKGLVFIGHGSSDAKAVCSALVNAQKAVNAGLLEKVGQKLEVLVKKLEASA